MPVNQQHTLKQTKPKYIRKCSDCELEARTEEDLKLFRANIQAKSGYLNICLTCYSKRYNPEGYARNLKRKELLAQGLKICRVCGETLPLNKFYKMKDGAGGRGTICSNCSYAAAKTWRLNNLEKARKSRRKSTKIYNQRIRYEALVYLSGHPPKCNRCGFTDIRALQIDHINGDGASERKHKGLVSSSICKYVLTLSEIEALKNYQVLCANCNWIKRVEEGTERGRYRRQ